MLNDSRMNIALDIAIALLTTTSWIDPSSAPREAIESTQWSQRIVRSFLRMHPDSISYRDEAKSRKWNYEQGLMMEGLFGVWKQTGDSQYVRYICRNLDYYVEPDGSIRTYKMSDFNLDNIAPGKALLRMYAATGTQQYRAAAETLRRQLSLQPRNAEGGFWHKKIYPDQMWLDGAYMAEPFYALYASMFGDTAAFDDVAHQFLLSAAHARDSATGLYYHGWDASRRQRWADPGTGCSPNFWGRSMGWFMMGLVDVLDVFPADHPRRGELVNMFCDLARAVSRYRDPSTHLWYQVVDKGGEKGNYLEASASAMFAYALTKGALRGYLPREFEKLGAESFRGILDNLVSVDAEGVVHLHHVCSVAGLGGNPYRNGSYSYYVGEPQRTDDFKGYGPFLLAAMEVEKLQSP